MVQVAIVDTETTGFLKPVIPVEIAILTLFGSPADCHIEDELVTRWCPGKQIELGAMSTHRITDEDVKSCTPFSSFQFPDGFDYIVGHSVDYDWEALGSPNVKRICTHAMARTMWPQESHKLAALFLLVAGTKAVSLLKSAHSALFDAKMVLSLVHRLAAEWAIESWDDMWLTSEAARLPTYMPFGKYGPKNGQLGLTLDEMVDKDRSYVHWLLNQADNVDPYLRKALESRL